MQRLWQQKRDQHLEIDDHLIDWIGRRAHTLNHKSGNKEGARIVRKLISDIIETRVQQELLHHPNAGRDHPTIQVQIEPAPEAPGDVAGSESPPNAGRSEERQKVLVHVGRA